jgi:hypothetical protein
MEALVNLFGMPGSGGDEQRRLREGFRPAIYFPEGASRFEAVIWNYQWGGVGLDVVVFISTLIATRNDPMATGSLARKVMPYGNALDTLYGVGHEIMFCILAAREAREEVEPGRIGIKLAQNTCAAVPEILKFLLAFERNDILMPCDLIFNWASAALCAVRVKWLYPAV